MEQVESLIKTTVAQIKELLDTTVIVGEPKVIEGITIVPLMTAGFVFAAGKGRGKGEEDSRGLTGGGAGMRPTALVIIDKDGIRVEPVRGALGGAVEKVAEVVPRVMEQMRERSKDRQQKKEG